MLWYIHVFMIYFAEMKQELSDDSASNVNVIRNSSAEIVVRNFHNSALRQLFFDNFLQLKQMELNLSSFLLILFEIVHL